MIKQYFTAIDDRGNIHIPSIEERGESYFLTFHKETLEGVQKLHVLPTLAKAKVGTDGFFITPRNIEMSGDLLVRFVPKEDTSYEYALPIMSCYGVKTAEVAALVRIERNYKYSFVFQTFIWVKIFCHPLLLIESSLPEGVGVSISIFSFVHDNKPGSTRHIEKAKRLIGT